MPTRLRRDGFRLEQSRVTAAMREASRWSVSQNVGGKKYNDINNGRGFFTSSDFFKKEVVQLRWAACPAPQPRVRAHQSWSQCNNTNEFRLHGSDLLRWQADEQGLIVFCAIIIHLILQNNSFLAGRRCDRGSNSFFVPRVVDEVDRFLFSLNTNPSLWFVAVWFR